jgi:Holliday junction resolvase-like predicted endonuclease
MDRLEDATARTPSQRVGDAAELLAANDLLSAGWQILATKLRLGREELDLVAVDPGPPKALVVIEVRWRRTREFGLAEETFDHRKRRHMWSAAMRLVDIGALPDGVGLPRLPVRLDLVVVEPPTEAGGPPRLRHYRNALLR